MYPSFYLQPTVPDSPRPVTQHNMCPNHHIIYVQYVLQCMEYIRLPPSRESVIPEHIALSSCDPMSYMSLPMFRAIPGSALHHQGMITMPADIRVQMAPRVGGGFARTNFSYTYHFLHHLHSAGWKCSSPVHTAFLRTAQPKQINPRKRLHRITRACRTKMEGNVAPSLDR